MPNSVDFKPRSEAPYYPAYPGTIDADEGGFDLKGALSFLRRRRRVIMLLALLGTAAGALYGYGRLPTYTAKALVVISPENNRVVDVQAVMQGLGSDTATIETQVRLLTSRAMLEKLVERLGRAGSTESMTAADLGIPVRPIDVALKDAAAALYEMVPSNWLFTVGLANEQVLLAPEEETAIEIAEKAEELGESLSVRQEGRSLVLSIAYTSPSPGEAAKVANALSELYIDEQVGDKIAATTKASDWLEVRLEELQGQVISAEEAIESYRTQNALQESKGIGIQSQQLAELTNMLIDSRAQRSEKESRLRYIRTLQGNHSSLNTISEVLNSPYMVRLWDQEQELARESTDLLNTYGAKHPRVVTLKGEQAKITDKINSEMQRIVANMGNEIDVLGARERSIRQDIDQLISSTDKAGQAEVKLRELERQADATRGLYENFLQRYKETREQQQLVEPDARVIAKAKAPTVPASIPPLMFVMLGFLGSTSAGVAVGWLIERLDSTLRSGKEIERLFGIPCLALVPFLTAAVRKKSRKPYQYVLAKPLSVYAETMRTIFTALRLANVDKPPQVFQITSSAPGEGKTTLSTSLAVSLAQSGVRSLLIDLDFRHPSVRGEMELAEGGCLTEYLAESATLAEISYRHQESGLDILAIKAPSLNANALVASRKLQELMAELRQRYDYIVVDSPPVLGVSDTKIIGGLADVTLFLARWGETTRDSAEDAIKDLLDHQIRIAGAVITQVDIARHAQYGYGGIDHYYSKYNKYYAN